MPTDILLRKNMELSAILQVCQVLTRSFELEHNLYAAMAILARHLEMQRGCVFLLDPASREIRIFAAYGLSAAEIRRGIYRIGEGIVGQVIASRASMFVPNIGTEPAFLNRTGSRPRKSGISFLCIPIEFDGEILGVLSVDRIYTEQHGDVDDDLRVLNIVASLIAQCVALWNHYRHKESECGELHTQLREKYSLPNLIGQSPAFSQVLKTVSKVAATETTVLLLGESGTGKELIARTLHYQSRRARERFVAVSLAALPDNLVEAELFGVEKGAFTGAATRRIGRFEAAERGTLFLDEIGELPLATQVKLLRVLQERSFERIGSSDSLRADVRVVAATNRNLLDEIARGTFREDLYWRLNVVPIVMPPLRARGEDIALLFDFYLARFNRQYGRQLRLDASAIALLRAYGWPGNIRELANMVEHLVITAESDCLSATDLPLNNHQGIAPARASGNGPLRIASGLGTEVEQLERSRILQALKRNTGIQLRAARELGITPRQLGYRIRKYEIDLRQL